jgi:hypothetical protein
MNNLGAGIRVAPQAGGAAFVSIARSDFSGNVFGIAADTSTAGSAGVNVMIRDSSLSGNKIDGIVAVAGASGSGITADFVAIADNGANGIRSIGANAIVRVGRSTITGNITGVTSVSGGQLLTSGSNLVQGNGTNGTFTGSFAFN